MNIPDTPDRAAVAPPPVLGVAGFVYADLHRPERLAELTQVFEARVAADDPDFWARWQPYKDAQGHGYDAKTVSDLLVAMAPHVSAFVADVFGIADARAEHALHILAQDPVFRFKRDFVARRAAKRPLDPAASAEALAAEMAILREVALGPQPPEDLELACARAVCALLDVQGAYDDVLRLKRGTEIAPEARVQMAAVRERLAASALRDSVPPPSATDDAALLDMVKALLMRAEAWAASELARQRPLHRDHRWPSMALPEEIKPDLLVPRLRPDPALPSMFVGLPETARRRSGFKLTDLRMSQRQALGEVHYCVYCHERDKDSCSKGFREKDGSYKPNALGVPLEGCPLDEKISEMHAVKKKGDSIGALALVLLDNPMVPGTGHRICNDCMKSCIFQKQDPVNIPQIETRVVTDVIFEMPWGYEVYAFLIRWNPLNVRRPHALPYNGKNILVVGSGPAGYTLAHWLLNEGFGVVIMDGLKIEPLPAHLVTGPDGMPPPLRDYKPLYQQLDERVLAGFGGVAEYGITVRWDKNFLKLLHLTLARRGKLAIYGGVRFGGTMTLDEAWAQGFDHVAMSTGAGRPTIVGMRNNLLRGIRKASDFLMALQLTGAFKADSLANLQVRLPAIVIGGGLTAVDTATELIAYYPLQVEKVLERYEKTGARWGEAHVRSGFDDEERMILDEALAHGRAVRAERERARAAREAPDLVSLVRGWGGVKLCYRKSLADAPAYRLNHEEVTKALEEGIEFVEGVSPKEAVADQFGHVAEIIFDSNAGPVRLPARAVMVAAGTRPNAIYEKEYPGTFRVSEEGEFLQGYREVIDAEGRVRLLRAGAAEDAEAFFTSYEKNGRYVTYYGDNHPAYAGNVVKAMASAKHGYPHVARLFAAEIAHQRPEDQPAREQAWQAMRARLDHELLAQVVRVDRLTPTIVEVVVKAPAAARHFKPGQFYRLQNFESLAPVVGGTRLVMEGLALTGAWVDRGAGLLGLITLEMGHSSRLCAALAPGEPVVLMGPTGTPTEIPQGETVLLAGGGLGNAVLFSIARALRAARCRVVYFAGYKKAGDMYKRDQIEAASDVVVWSTDVLPAIPAARPQDKSFVGNIIEAMIAYGTGALGETPVVLSEVDRVIAIGSDRMMSAVQRARHDMKGLGKLLQPGHVGIGSINSPMQCMMKEVCAQCLQKHLDPHTGKEVGFVFSCWNQDQELDRVDFAHLAARLRQNTVQEKMANLWLDYVLEERDVRRV